MSEKEKFVYHYSAKQQEEIRTIREKYVDNEEDKVTQLKRLDQQVSNRAAMISIVWGLISTLVFGVGMCCVLEWEIYVPGIIIGFIGIAGMGSTHMIHGHLLKKFRKKIAPKIIELTDELMK